MNEIHTDIIRPDGLAIPDETTQEQWEALHRHILLAKRAAGKWLSQSRSWASERWGIDYVAETEVQMELALGIETAAPKPSLNPQDKSRGIVTIEGIAQSFDLWHRKVAPEIAGWGRDKLERALELLEPIARQAEALRAILKGGGGSVDNYASRGVQNDSERS
jgi:hypothetical protein